MHYKEGGEPVVLALRVVLARRSGLGGVGGLRQGSLLDRRQGRLRREGRQGRRRRNGPRVGDGGTRALLDRREARVLDDDSGRLLPAPMEEAPSDRQRRREAANPSHNARNEFHRGKLRGGRVVVVV